MKRPESVKRIRIETSFTASEGKSIASITIAGGEERENLGGRIGTLASLSNFLHREKVAKLHDTKFERSPRTLSNLFSIPRFTSSKRGPRVSLAGNFCRYPRLFRSCAANLVANSPDRVKIFPRNEGILGTGCFLPSTFLPLHAAQQNSFSHSLRFRIIFLPDVTKDKSNYRQNTTIFQTNLQTNESRVEGLLRFYQAI